MYDLCLSEEEVLRQLEALLEPRIASAERGETVGQNVTDMMDACQQERRARTR